MKKIFLLMIILLIEGCYRNTPTPYQPLGEEGGYSEMALAHDTYKVTFCGNTHTTSDRVYNMLLIRSAEITLNNGYSYFIILGNKQDVQTSYVQAPSRIIGANQGLLGAFLAGQAGNLSGEGYTVTHGQSYQLNAYTHSMIIKMLKSNKGVSDALNAQITLNNFYH